MVETPPDTTVPVTIVRDRERTTLEITIAELDLENEGQNRSARTEDLDTGFGMTLTDLTGQLSRRLRAPSDMSGAVVSALQNRGAAARGGIQRGDIILQINRTEITQATEATSMLREVESGQTALFLVWRNGAEVFLQVTKE